MNNPLVSIAIPVYNRANLVLETLQYIINQTYSNWELILVDDGSSEKDYQIIESAASKDSRISVVKRPDNREKGAQTCRNMGTEMAKGKYIIYFDSDDFIPNFCLEQRVLYMETHPDADFAVFPFAEFEDDPNKPHLIGGVKFYEDDLMAFVSRRLPFMVWSNIYRLGAVKDNNLIWDTKLKSLQDAYFNITALCAGLKYEYAVNNLVDYYNRTASKGASISKGIYSPNHFESHIYYLKSVRDAVSSIPGTKKPLRDGCLYIYSLMMYNYSKEDSRNLLSCLSSDWSFYMWSRVKDFLYGNCFRKLHVGVQLSRWILFPLFSFNRKHILKEQRAHCEKVAMRAHF